MATQLDTAPTVGPSGAPPVLDDRVTTIRPTTGRPRLDLRELWHYRELLGIFVWRDLAVRYKQTIVGIAWAIFQPALIALVYATIFGRFGSFPSAGVYYPVFVFGGLLPMLYFNSALSVGSSSLVANVNLVTKVYFPRLLLPLGALVTPIVDFFLGLTVLVVFMLVTGELPANVWDALLAPVWLLLAFAAVLGPVLLLSAINVRYRDVPYAIPVFLLVMPFLSGVVFAITDATPERWQRLLYLNPMTTAVAGWRWSLFGTPLPSLYHASLGLGVTFVLLVAGFLYFRRAEPKFADQI
ncbi:MAG: ABC transporter permease [Gaiellales bacterium]